MRTIPQSLRYTGMTPLSPHALAATQPHRSNAYERERKAECHAYTQAVMTLTAAGVDLTPDICSVEQQLRWLAVCQSVEN